MTDRPELSETDLEALLAQARRAPPPPLPAGLQARLLADAAAALPPPGSARSPGRLWAWLSDLGLAELGGLPGLAGMSAAGVAGLWIGLADPLPGLELTALLGDGPAALLAGAEDSPFAAFDPLD